MPDAERLVAKLGPLFHEFPELILIAFRAAGHVHQVDRHRSLIEAAIVLVAAIRIQAYGIRCQKCPAAHAGVHIPVLQLLHHLGTDIIRHHAFR